MEILEKRLERMKEVISNRQFDLTVILENVHDPHNIGAVLRTCDSVGIQEIYLIYTDERLKQRGVKVGTTSSSGAKQWIDVHYHENVAECFDAVRKKYNKIYGTAIGADSVSLYDLPLADSCALLFGNEHAGISPEALVHVDQNFLIPQYGFVQSLNISVACAVSLYEACRQREIKSAYSREFGGHALDESIYEKYVDIHKQKKYNKINNRKLS